MSKQDSIIVLLSILDMPEVQQRRCLETDGILEKETAETVGTCLIPSFADIAFRIRDEVIKAGCDWLEAVCAVIQYCEGEKRCEACGQNHKTKKYFNWSDDAQPIHWIIAALIAEVIRKKEENVYES